jgi:hypothetical protein
LKGAHDPGGQAAQVGRPAAAAAAATIVAVGGCSKATGGRQLVRGLRLALGRALPACCRTHSCCWKPVAASQNGSHTEQQSQLPLLLITAPQPSHSRSYSSCALAASAGAAKWLTHDSGHPKLTQPQPPVQLLPLPKLQSSSLTHDAGHPKVTQLHHLPMAHKYVAAGTR